MAMLSEAARRVEREAGEGEATGRDTTENGARARRYRRAAQTSIGAAKGTMLAALGTFPIVAAYHIDFGPEIALEVDLGTVLWAMLAPCALGCWLNGVRLLRQARRVSRSADHARA
jgi:hypothetical protein